MTDSRILFSLFYYKIRTEITLYLQTNPEKEEYLLFIQKVAKLFEEKYASSQKMFLMNTISNDLVVYLQMIEFIKEKQKPFMTGILDATNVVNIFNRFYYTYALSAMTNNCSFSSDISNIIHSYLQNT
jgi:outer membrane receptor protein involved in Fe transport